MCKRVFFHILLETKFEVKFVYFNHYINLFFIRKMESIKFKLLKKISISIAIIVVINK